MPQQALDDLFGEPTASLDDLFGDPMDAARPAPLASGTVLTPPPIGAGAAPPPPGGWPAGINVSGPSPPQAGMTAAPEFRRTAGGEVGFGLLRGVTIAAEGIAGVGEAVGLDKLIDIPSLTEPFQRMREGYLRPSDKLAAAGAWAPDDWRWWAGRGSEAIGTLIPAMVPGLGASSVATRLGMSGRWAMALAAGTGGAVAGAIEGGLQYVEMRDQLVERGYTLQEAESISRIGALAYGLAAGMVEVVPMTQLLKYVPGGRKALLRIIISAGTEGGEEVVQEVLSRLTSVLTGADPEALVYDQELKDALKASGSLGAVAGGVVSTVIPGRLPPKQKPKRTQAEIVADVKATTGKTTVEVTPESIEGLPPKQEPDIKLEQREGDALHNFLEDNGVDPAAFDELAPAQRGRVKKLYDTNLAAGALLQAKRFLKKTGAAAASGEGSKPEAAKPPAEPAPALTEPWKLSKGEFDRKYAGKWLPGVMTSEGRFVVGQDHGHARERAEEAGFTVPAETLGQMAGWKIGGEIVLDKDFLEGNPDQLHEFIVRRAVQEGKDVPVEVLAEFGIEPATSGERKLAAKEPSRARTKEAKAAQQKEEGQPQAAQRKGRRYTKAETSRVLESARNEIGGSIQSKLDRANDILEGHPGFDDESNVHGSFVLPLDALDSLTPIQKARITKAGFRESGDYSFQERVLGADFMQQVVDEIIATSGGGKGNLDILAGQIIDNPQAVDADVWFAAYHRLRERTAKVDKRHRPELFEDPQSLRENDEWTMLGDEWVVEADENGILWIANDEYTLPLEHVSAIPMDEGSLKRASLEQPVKGGQEGITPELAPAITGKQKGLFVAPTKSALQTEVDADTASKKLAAEKDQADVAPTGPLFGARRGMVDLEPLVRTVKLAITAGKWTVKSTSAAASWLYQTAETSISFAVGRTMLVNQFGAGIKAFVGKVWTAFKGMVAAEFKPMPKRVFEAGQAAPRSVIVKLTETMRASVPIQRDFEERLGELRKHQAAIIRGVREAYLKNPEADPEVAIAKAMGAMSGRIPKLSVTPLKDILTIKEIKQLLDHWWSHDYTNEEMSPQQQASIAGSLINLILNGEIPFPHEVRHLEVVFGPQFARLLAKYHMNGMRRFRLAVINALSLPKSFKSSLDFSAVFRQGRFIWTTSASYIHEGKLRVFTPVQGGVIPFLHMMRSAIPFAGEIYGRRTDRWIRKMSGHKRRISHGLYMPSYDPATALTEHEEIYQGRLFANIPILRHLQWITGLRWAERNFQTMLNVQRALFFDFFADRIENQYEVGKITKTEMREQLRNHAKLTNAGTGRGNVDFGDVQTFLNAVAYAPRFAWSQFELPIRTMGRPLTQRGSRFLAAQVLTSQAVYFGALFLLIKQLADWNDWDDTEFDIRPHSPTFGRIRMGKTSIDMASGMGGAWRRAFQSVLPYGRAYDPTTEKYKEAMRFEDSLVWYMRGKRSPTSAYYFSYREGKNYDGEEMIRWADDPLGAAKQAGWELFAPITVEQIDEVLEYEEDNAIELMTAEFFGAGVSIYDPARHRKKKKKQFKVTPRN